MLNLNSQNFKEKVIDSKKLFLVDFWAPGCPPCKIMSPIVEEIEKELKVRLGKVNIKENPQLAQEYKVMAVPTLIIFKEGEAKERATGLRSKKVVSEKLKSLF